MIIISATERLYFFTYILYFLWLTFRPVLARCGSLCLVPYLRMLNLYYSCNISMNVCFFKTEVPIFKCTHCQLKSFYFLFFRAYIVEHSLYSDPLTYLCYASSKYLIPGSSDLHEAAAMADRYHIFFSKRLLNSESLIIH